MTENKKWYAVYTKPRWEKKVAELLKKSNITTYCPLNKVLRQWSDRKKIVYEPLFQSYVFVYVMESEQSSVRQIDGILNFVYWLGKPAVIKDFEIELIQQFLETHKTVKIEKADVGINDIVRIVSGPFMEHEGSVVLVKQHTVKVALPSLGYIMSAEVDKSNIEVIKHKETVRPVNIGVE